MKRLRSISIDELDGLQLDENNHLYWKTNKVITEKVVSLRCYELILATIVALGTALSGLEALLHILPILGKP